MPSPGSHDCSRHGRIGRTLISLLTAGTLVLVSASHGLALNITLNFNAAASEAPAFDPNATGLQSLFGFAESYYQDVFEDTHNLTINFWYEDLPSTTTGQHTLISQGGTPNRELEANIRIDTRVGTGGAFQNWFIDNTPGDNSEFSMLQTLWRDLDSAEKSNFYSNFGTQIPETFEVGFTGAPVPGGAAVGLRDMLSVVMHEVGHALGMAAANNATVNQTIDLDYDYNPAFVFGQTLAADVAAGGNIAHLNNPIAVMFPSIGANIRKLPSHSDLFSMASGHAYTLLDVPRREFYGGTNWNNRANWSGNQVPGPNDDTFLRGGGDSLMATLSAPAFARDLHVLEGANVSTGGFKLSALTNTRISHLTSYIYVGTGGELETPSLEVSDGAMLIVDGGLVDANVITLAAGSTFTALEGSGGTVDVFNRLTNNAIVRASVGGGTLVFASVGGSVWDLDGVPNGSVENGSVEAAFGNLNFSSGSLTDTFNGRMRIGDGVGARTLTIAQPWSLGLGGVITLNGGTASGQRASLAGGTLTAMDGTIQASAGHNWIDAPAILGGALVTNTSNGGNLEFNGHLTVSGGQFNSAGTGATVFDGVTTYSGGTVTIAGTLSQNGAATVSGPTTIQGDIFNFDGLEFAPASWTLMGPLTLNVLEIDNVGESIDGQLTINGLLQAVLTVNTPAPWSHEGTITVNASPTITSTSIAGGEFTASGTVNINGRTRFSSPTRLTGTMTLQTSSSRFTFGASSAEGLNRLEGGIINGSSGSTIAASGDTTLTGFGTIRTRIDFDSGTSLLADDGTLNLTGALLDLGIIGTAASDGTLNVVSAWDTGLADQLLLKGGTVTGGGITNDGQTNGSGIITSASFVNNSIVAAKGGTLTFNTSTFPELDGTTNTGELRAVGGNILVMGASDPRYVFNGRMDIGAGRKIELPGSSFSLAGTLDMDGGEFASLGSNHRGQLHVGAGPLSWIRELGAGGFFENASTGVLIGDLALSGSFRVSNGAQFSGAGQLIVDASSVLRIDSGASLGVSVSNLGRLFVDPTPGTATLAAFAQSASGVYETEIDGTTPGTQYDQLQVTGNAILGGTLDIQINQNGGTYSDPVVPGSSHVFTLLTANGISGDFDVVTYAGTPLVPEFGVGSGGDFAALSACGLFRIMDYSTTDLQLINYRALPGDANADGFVDGSDFGIWNTSKFRTKSDWASGDFNCDGVTDGSDFGIWNANKFTGVGLPLLAGGDASVAFQLPLSLHQSVVPEPHMGGFWFLLLAVRIGRRLHNNCCIGA